VGVYLGKPVFGHGQLYVALSRARRFEDIKVAESFIIFKLRQVYIAEHSIVDVNTGKLRKLEKNETQNIVHEAVLVDNEEELEYEVVE